LERYKIEEEAAHFGGYGVYYEAFVADVGSERGADVVPHADFLHQ